MTTDLRDTVKHVNDIADAIERIDQALPVLRERLTDKALVVLIRNACGKSTKLEHVEEVLEGMGRLKEMYIKDPENPQTHRKGKSK
jgi:hypothetical protein